MDNHTYKRLALITFKYAPVLTAGIMLIHMILLMFDIRLGYAETVCGLSLIPLVVTYLLSKGLGFCWMHRMFIDYTFKMFLCIQWQHWIGFGKYLNLAHFIMLFLGIGIFIYFLFHIKEFMYGKFKQSCINNTKKLC